MAFIPLAQYVRHANHVISATTSHPPHLARPQLAPADWANQDVVATIKQQLLLLTPGAKIFLECAAMLARPMKRARRSRLLRPLLLRLGVVVRVYTASTI